MTKPFCEMTAEGDLPLVVTAIHAGHEARDEVAALFALDDAGRLREEDPFTDFLTAIAGNRIVVNRSRFEVDLNRPREKAVYLLSADAWGLEVWKKTPERALVERSLAEFDRFYEQAEQFLADLVRRFGYFVVLDLHSYNHLRQGPEGPPEPPEANPEVNVGTGNLDRDRWSPVVEGFIDELSRVDFQGRRLDVRENVKFRGGYFSKWIFERFGPAGCAMAVEFKKFFMDEWTGRADPDQMAAITEALRKTLPGILRNAAAVADGRSDE